MLYYGLHYRNFITVLLDCQAEYWVVRAGEDIHGVLPMMSREGPYGTVWNSLPFYGSHGGVLAGSHEAAARLYEQYQQMTSAPSVAAATLVSNPFHLPEVARLQFDLVDNRIGQLTTIGGNDRTTTLSSTRSRARPPQHSQSRGFGRNHCGRE